MNKKLFKDYAEIESQIAVLSEKKEAIRDLCLAEMQKEEAKKVEAEGIGTFSIVERKSWTYSPKVMKQEKVVESEEKILKTLQEKEQTSGVAKAELKESLRFQAIKVE